MKTLLSILLLNLCLSVKAASPGMPYFVLDRPLTPYQQRIGVYYRMDDATDASQLVDEISGLDLYPITPWWGPISVSGQITNAIQLGYVPEPNNWAVFESLALTNAPDWSAWNLASNSFTVRCWFKTPDDGNFAVWYLGNVRLQYNVGRTLTFSLWDGVTYLDPVSLPDTNWHRVVCFWERGVSIGIKIDNNETVTLATTDGVPDASAFDSGSGVDIGQTTGTVTGFIDELGIWKYKWTEEDMTWDWNAGAGRTYP
ncbi:MAG: hypothetical protein NT154_15105 [Verrucomicrobia bacterium]|nr:hypothetical protein [Verrucomicrobiota bacterium]